MSCANLFNRVRQTLHNPHLFIVCTLWKALACNIKWRNSTGITWHTLLNVISFKGRPFLRLSLAGSRATWKKIHSVLNMKEEGMTFRLIPSPLPCHADKLWLQLSLKAKACVSAIQSFFFLPCFFVSYYHLLSQMIRWRICVNRISEPFHLPHV